MPPQLNGRRSTFVKALKCRCETSTPILFASCVPDTLSTPLPLWSAYTHVRIVAVVVCFRRGALSRSPYQCSPLINPARLGANRSVCKSCIVRHFANHESCPTCGVTISGTNHMEMLRPDRTMQSIVYKLVTGLQEGALSDKDHNHLCPSFPSNAFPCPFLRSSKCTLCR